MVGMAYSPVAAGSPGPFDSRTPASRAAETVAEAFRELGLEPRFQEFELARLRGDEPELVVDGERWPAGPCMYAHPFDGEGTVKRIGESPAPVGDGTLPNFAIVDADGPRGRAPADEPVLDGRDPVHVVAHAHHDAADRFVSIADSERLDDGMRVRLKVGGRFVPGRRERNVIADLPGGEASACSSPRTTTRSGTGRARSTTRPASKACAVSARRSPAASSNAASRLVAFAAEEIKLTGSHYFVDEAKLRGELDAIVGVVNLDCIAHGEQLNILASPDALLGRAVEAARGLGLLDRYALETGPATGGVDSHWFADAGVPAATILHFPYDEYHLPYGVTRSLSTRS